MRRLRCFPSSADQSRWVFFTLSKLLYLFIATVLPTRNGSLHKPSVEEIQFCVSRKGQRPDALESIPKTHRVLAWRAGTPESTLPAIVAPSNTQRRVCSANRAPAQRPPAGDVMNLEICFSLKEADVRARPACRCVDAFCFS